MCPCQIVQLFDEPQDGPGHVKAVARIKGCALELAAHRSQRSWLDGVHRVTVWYKRSFVTCFII